MCIAISDHLLRKKSRNYRYLKKRFYICSNGSHLTNLTFSFLNNGEVEFWHFNLLWSFPPSCRAILSVKVLFLHSPWILQQVSIPIGIKETGTSSPVLSESSFVGTPWPLSSFNGFEQQLLRSGQGPLPKTSRESVEKLTGNAN